MQLRRAPVRPSPPFAGRVGAAGALALLLKPSRLTCLLATQVPCASVSSPHCWEDVVRAVPELCRRNIQVFLGQI